MSTILEFSCLTCSWNGFVYRYILSSLSALPYTGCLLLLCPAREICGPCPLCVFSVFSVFFVFLCCMCFCVVCALCSVCFLCVLCILSVLRNILCVFYVYFVLYVLMCSVLYVFVLCVFVFSVLKCSVLYVFVLSLCCVLCVFNSAPLSVAVQLFCGCQWGGFIRLPWQQATHLKRNPSRIQYTRKITAQHNNRAKL